MRRLDNDLRALIARVRRRWTLLTGLRTANRGAVLLAALVLGAVLFDKLVRPEGAALLLIAASAAALAVTVLALVLRRAPRSPDDRQVARFIEERAAALGHSLDDALVSAETVASSRLCAASSSITT